MAERHRGTSTRHPDAAAQPHRRGAPTRNPDAQPHHDSSSIVVSAAAKHETTRASGVVDDEPSVMPGRFDDVPLGRTFLEDLLLLMAQIEMIAAPPLFASSLGVATVGSPSDPAIPRTSLLNGIEVGLHNAHQRYVLYGPKGVGKSYLAHRYGQQWIAKGDRYHVRWFSAASREVLQGEYRAFLKDSFGGKISDPNPEDLQRAVRRLFASTPNVLLIFDGVEDEAMLEQFLHSLLPIRGQTAPNVFVLITTSSSSICTTGSWTALQDQHRKAVSVFSDAEMLKYLKQVLPGRPDDATKLQADLRFRLHVGNHPKRLHWVSALFAAKPSMTVGRLVEDLRNVAAPGGVDPAFTCVLGAMIAHCTHSNTKGWEMLCLAAQLADAPIPVELLCIAMGATQDEADCAIRSLQRFSLAEVTCCNTDGATTVPCVVVGRLARDEAIRYNTHYNCYTDAAPSLRTTLLVALNILAASSSAFQRLRNSVPSMEHLCYPHAVHAISASLSSSECRRSTGLAASKLLMWMASLMHRIGCYSSAVKHAMQSLEMRRAALPPGPHPGLVATLHWAMNLFSAVDRHEQALQHAVEALEMLLELMSNGQARDDWCRPYVFACRTVLLDLIDGQQLEALEDIVVESYDAAMQRDRTTRSDNAIRRDVMESTSYQLLTDISSVARALVHRSS